MAVINEMRLDFPADPVNEAFARMAISAFIVPLNPTIEQMADVKTAVSEAVTNAIVHGYRDTHGTVRLRADYRDDGLVVIDVCDRGCGISDIARAREPFYTTLEGEERSGMGFTVMESFMDGVEVKSEVGRGTTVRLLKQLDVRGMDRAHLA
ncbi:MAG: anti-sigma F factor [Clostridia bacterium]|nr:anti-sigma F factor [Clostridia bacterium]